MLRSRSLPCLIFAVSFLFAQSAVAQLQGKVVSVADGDTLTILDASRTQHRVRLAEIDAPESEQAFGTRSKQLLSRLCHRKQATVRDTSNDRYGRVVGTVYCEGVNANAEMVRQGQAWVYVKYARRGSALYALERQARDARLGLWSEPASIEPWLWRRGERTVRQGASIPSVVRGNSNSMIYHLHDCPDFDKISKNNRVSFLSESAAQSSGYRKAGNCP